MGVIFVLYFFTSSSKLSIKGYFFFLSSRIILFLFFYFILMFFIFLSLFYFRSYVHLDGNPIIKEGVNLVDGCFYSHAYLPAKEGLEWMLIDWHLSPRSEVELHFWQHLDVAETSAATKACWEITLWDITWSLIANVKEWQVSRNMIALPLMCILSVNREVAISGALRALIRGLCFNDEERWSVRFLVGELLKLTLIPRKLITNVNRWLSLQPDLDFIVKLATSADDIPAPHAFCAGFADKVGCLDDGSGSLAFSIIAALTNKVMEGFPQFLRPSDLRISRSTITTWMAPQKTFISYTSY